MIYRFLTWVEAHPGAFALTVIGAAYIVMTEVLRR